MYCERIYFGILNKIRVGKFSCREISKLLELNHSISIKYFESQDLITRKQGVLKPQQPAYPKARCHQFPLIIYLQNKAGCIIHPEEIKTDQLMKTTGNSAQGEYGSQGCTLQHSNTARNPEQKIQLLQIPNLSSRYYSAFGIRDSMLEG